MEVLIATLLFKVKTQNSSKERGYMYTYGWFMLSLDRKQQNSVKQLSFNKKNKLKNNNKEFVYDINSN